MSALTAARVILVSPGAIKNVTYPLAAGAKAFENGMACYDTSAYGAVVRGAVSTTLVPIGTFTGTFDNSAGGATVPIGIELFKEHQLTYWDSVTGGGAITIANLFQLVYIADDHTLTTVSTGASAFGRVWWVSPPGYPAGVGVEQSA